MTAVVASILDLGGAAGDVAERLSPSVVEVFSRGRGNGAGTIWREDGIVITNHHVVPGDGAHVRLADGRALDARAVAHDPVNDLAVLKVDARGLAAAPIGDARGLRAGEIVVAIGHPYGNRGTVTVGIVTAASGDGQAPGERELVRAAVLLGPGNSGGPLADARGRVVGINAMVAGGLAMAVPSHLVERLLAPDEGRARIGVEAREVAIPPSMGVGARRGLMVLAVRAGSPADRSGLLVGDVILSDLASLVPEQTPLSVLRGGRVISLSVVPEREERRAA